MPDVMPAAAIVSIIGTVFFLGSFGGLNLGLIKSDSYLYQMSNLLGAACFTYTAISPFNSGLFITEFIWCGIGCYGVYKIASTAKKNKAANPVATS